MAVNRRAVLARAALPQRATAQQSTAKAMRTKRAGQCRMKTVPHERAGTGGNRVRDEEWNKEKEASVHARPASDGAAGNDRSLARTRRITVW